MCVLHQRKWIWAVFPAVTVKLWNRFRPEVVKQAPKLLLELAEHSFYLKTAGIGSDDIFRRHRKVSAYQNNLFRFVFCKDKLQRLIKLLTPQVSTGKIMYLLFTSIYGKLCLMER